MLRLELKQIPRHYLQQLPAPRWQSRTLERLPQRLRQPAKSSAKALFQPFSKHPPFSQREKRPALMGLRFTYTQSLILSSINAVTPVTTPPIETPAALPSDGLKASAINVLVPPAKAAAAPSNSSAANNQMSQLKKLSLFSAIPFHLVFSLEILALFNAFTNTN